MQLDDPAPEAQQLWSWQSNIDEGLERLENGRNEAQYYLNAIQRTYPNQWEIPPATHTDGNTVMTSMEAAIIQLYNGAAVVEQLLGPNQPATTPLRLRPYYRSCWSFSPNNAPGTRWDFSANRNGYVHQIVQEFIANPNQ